MAFKVGDLIVNDHLEDVLRVASTTTRHLYVEAMKGGKFMFYGRVPNRVKQNRLANPEEIASGSRTDRIKGKCQC
ncbi:hypothetical protein [Acinetobacter proteolyticus]|uniref:Uncharacterized protein n=1 Tax=Acinetobacter proteolyticus TaxID=1776741 RepID=A0A2N0WIB0_9GAMM|nr:hypothetical protein [Acinetobacter proteolyticus]PKF35514.1 hypothetical protein CW311_04285 [Acinetobacter proteolyticus]